MQLMIAFLNCKIAVTISTSGTDTQETGVFVCLHSFNTMSYLLLLYIIYVHYIIMKVFIKL
jgi:hypothetical protein